MYIFNFYFLRLNILKFYDFFLLYNVSLLSKICKFISFISEKVNFYGYIYI